MKIKYVLGALSLLYAGNLPAQDTTVFSFAQNSLRSDTAPANLNNPLWLYLFQIIIFIAVLLVAAFLVKKFYSNKLLNKTKNPIFTLLYTHFIGKNNFLQVYKIFDNITVIAVSKDNITPILTITDKQKVDTIILQLSKNAKRGEFKNILKNNSLASLFGEIYKKGGHPDEQ